MHYQESETIELELTVVDDIKKKKSVPLLKAMVALYISVLMIMVKLWD